METRRAGGGIVGITALLRGKEGNQRRREYNNDLHSGWLVGRTFMALGFSFRALFGITYAISQVFI